MEKKLEFEDKYKNELFMKEALKEAEKAYKKEEVPVGAIIVKNGKIIARAHNLRETKKTSTAHAEILAINKASKKINSWRLIDCEMYVTLEPCTMCMGAIISSRIKKLYIGTLDEKTGACGSFIDLNKYKYNHNVEIEIGILNKDCKYILKDFFKKLREEKRRKKMFKDRQEKRMMHWYIMRLILVLAISIIIFLIYKYEVEGEKNLPFNITKSVIISTAQTDKVILEEEEYKAEIIQKNDIYLVIEKNEKYKKDDIIKKITLNNFQIKKYTDVGTIKIYRPSKTEELFVYDEENIVDSMEFFGSNETNLKSDDMQIANQGGIINFSITLEDLGTVSYSENENLLIDGTLINRLGLTLENIQFDISFDIIIELESGNTFKTTMTLKLPEDTMLEQGVSSIENTKLDLVFKRI